MLSPADEDDNVWDEARRGAGDTDKLEQAPAALRPGGSEASTKPFLKRKPVPQRQDPPPVDSFAQMDLNEASETSNPWQGAIVTQDTPTGNPERPKTDPVLPDEAESDPTRPVILITHETTEEAVRRALEAVSQDGHLEGEPRMIRIEALS